MLRIGTVCGVLGLALLALSVLPWSAPAAGEAIAPVSAPMPGSTADAAYGKALFRAKGCATCHVHAAISGVRAIPEGPNLTDYRADPTHLRSWLRDPKAVKPLTRMPNLGLSDAEIAALIAFLSADDR